MIRYDELALDIIAVVLIAFGSWLLIPALGFIIAGFGVALLSIGVKARRGSLRSEPYRGREVDA